MLISRRFQFDGASTLKLNELQKDLKIQIQEKFKQGEYQFTEIQNCKNCEAESFRLIAEKDRYGFKHSVRICKLCGLIQQNPHYTQKTYNKFYDTEYRKLYSGKKRSIEEIFEDQYARGKEIINFLDIRLEDKTVLEIGTGTGGILKAFEEEGAKVRGLDLGSRHINYAKGKGLNVAVGGLKDVDNLNPDIVVYSHVLEHITRPRNELKELRDKFSNFYLYVEVPGVRNLKNSYQGDFLKQLQNSHITYFTKETLTNLLNRENFEVEKSNKEIKCLAMPSQKINFQKVSEFRKNILYLKSYEILRYLPLSKHLLKSNIRKIGRLLEKFNLKRYFTPAYRSYLKSHLQ